MGSGFSSVFSTDAGDTGNEYQPLGGDPSPPDEKSPDGDGPPPEVASEYQPLGGEPTDPGDPIA